MISGAREIFEIFEATAGYGFEIQCNGETYEGSFDITSLVGKDSLYAAAEIRAFRLPKRKWNYIPIKTESFTIDDIVVKDCIIADSLNAGYGVDNPDKRIEKFVISKEHGLIYYRFEDGDEFTPKLKRGTAQ